MKPETREKRVTEIMTEIINKLSKTGPLSLTSMSESYRTSNEMAMCLMAFSRLEAEDLISKNVDGEWEISQKD